MQNSASQFRIPITVSGAALLVPAAGYALSLPWATATWPWPDGRLSYLFVGSIIAAIAAALIWIGLSGEWAAMQAGAVTTLVMCCGMGGYLLLLQLGGRPDLLGHIVSLVLAAAASLATFIWSRRFSFRERRPLPRYIAASFVVFVLALLLAGTALILRAPAIFPWPLNDDSAVLFGLIFFADAVYFAYPLLLRHGDVRAQLLSFLAYDIFLIPPFLTHISAVDPDHLPSLIIYLAVLLYSAALAIYYLFVDRAGLVRLARPNN